MKTIEQKRGSVVTTRSYAPITRNNLITKYLVQRDAAPRSAAPHVPAISSNNHLLHFYVQHHTCKSHLEVCHILIF